MNRKSTKHAIRRSIHGLIPLAFIAAGVGMHGQAAAQASASNAQTGAACSAVTPFVYGFPGKSPTVGSAAKLSVATQAGYYRDECLDVKVQFIDGSAPTVQFIESGTVDAGSPFSSAIYQDLAAGGTAKAFYSEINQNNTQPQVLKDSKIRSAKDLLGKTVGIASLSSGSKLIVDMYIKSAGGDPAKDVKYVAVGFGAGAAKFLTDGKVDAIALYDGAHAQISSQLGVPLRGVTDPKVDGDKVGFWLPLVSTSEKIKTQRDKLTRFGRAFAKAYLLTATNPECAVRLHWQAYPDSRPTGVNESKAMDDALVVLKARMQFAEPDKRGYGYVSNEQIDAQTELLASIGAIGKKYPASTLFTPDLLADINNFDHAQVLKDAATCRGLKR